MSQRVTGRVKWFNNTKGFGFIELGEGNDVFVHFRAITGDGYRTLNKDQLVEFKVMEGPKGLHAEEVVKLSGDGTASALSQALHQGNNPTGNLSG
jgi:cold shock protein